MNREAFVKREARLEDLDPKHWEIARMVGLEKYLELCIAFGGSSYYLPSLKCISDAAARRKILESRALVQSKALSINRLARMYGVSESTVYNILKEE